MKVFFLFLTELVLAILLISFIWYLCDAGNPVAHVTFIGKMLSIGFVLLGIGAPIISGIYVGVEIDKEIK